MPEGDTVWRQARSLHRALAGRIVHSTSFRYPDCADINLASQPIHGAYARGKHLFLNIGDMSVHSHLRMDGIWHLYGVTPSGAPERWKRPAYTVRALINANARTDQAGNLVPGSTPVSAVGYLLGMLNVIPTAEAETLVAHLGPDLLGPDWDLDRAVANLLKTPERAIGPALLDQKNLAGIGTIYRAETLFLAGINPSRPVGDIKELDRLLEISRLLLEANKMRPLRVTRTEKEPLWCYGRARRPCYRCGTNIIKEDMTDLGMGADQYGKTPHHYQREEDISRIIFFCPRCQQ